MSSEVTQNILSVSIDLPVAEVFEFTTNPQKTPLWIEGMEEEQASEFPPKVGSFYRNRSFGCGVWSVYEVSGYEKDRLFALRREDGYNVVYTYQPYEKGTLMTYDEWMEDGKGGLEELFTLAHMEKLKAVMEAER